LAVNLANFILGSAIGRAAGIAPAIIK